MISKEDIGLPSMSTESATESGSVKGNETGTEKWSVHLLLLLFVISDVFEEVHILIIELQSCFNFQ